MTGITLSMHSVIRQLQNSTHNINHTTLWVSLHLYQQLDFFLPPVECLDPLDMPAEALCVSGKCEMRDCEIKNSFKLASVELTEDLRIRRHARQRIFSSGYFDNAFPFGTRVINSDMIHQVEIEIAEIPLCFEAKIAQCFCKRPSSLYGLFLKTLFI